MLPIMTTFLNFDDFFPTMFIFSFFQVLASECCDISYNDLDLIFTVDLPTQKHYERVSEVVKSYLYLHLYLYLYFSLDFSFDIMIPPEGRGEGAEGGAAS